MDPELHPAVADLREVVDLAVHRGGALLTQGEHVVVQRVRRLNGEAALLYARLTSRVPNVFEVSRLTSPGVQDVPGALAELERKGLVDGLVPWPQRAAHLPRATLTQGARALGLPTTGRRDDLVERLAPHANWHPGRWIRLLHPRLIRRLEQWAQLRAHPDRATWIVARLGVVRWPEYQLTRGPKLWPTRRALRAWERLLEPDLPVEQALTAIANDTGRAPGRLSVHRHLVSAVAHMAHEHERAGEPGTAIVLYEQLHDARVPLPDVAFRWSRALEAGGDPRAAFQLLKRSRRLATGTRAIEISRAGRRLARSLRRGWAPDRPLLAASERHLRMAPAEPAVRPRWHGGNEPEVVEAAARSLLAAHGRVSVHGEGRLWRTLFALLFADVYFLPIAGALPVTHLSGPLDLGTPGFRARRSDAIGNILRAVVAGEAPDRIRHAHARWEGVHLAWARWDVTDAETLAAIAEGIGGTALRSILEALLDHGRPAARGLPDLVVLPGPAVDLPATVPRKLGAGLLLAEIKGPSDALRDAQALWVDRLLRVGVQTEIWNVRALPKGCPVETTRHCAV